jgi:ADP-ribosylglycohydrolase
VLPNHAGQWYDRSLMLGAIAGDIIGSVYEADPIKTTRFPLLHHECCFTDDSVLTVATADSILTGTGYAEKYREYFHRYPDAGYGALFAVWAASRSMEPYHSFGNGSAMRVSPVGFAFETLEEVLEEALKSAEVTHNHPEGVKGAQATAAAVFLARTGRSKEEIRSFIQETFQYRLDRSIDEIREQYEWDATCQGTVPQAITAFLDSTDWEDAVRKAISLGGDSDTLACITGGMAQAFYGGVPDPVARRVFHLLDGPLTEVVLAFEKRYMP